jgi:hypothetical protein
MKKLIPQILGTFFVMLAFSLQGCRNDDELQTRLVVLGNEKLQLANQKDSVIKLLAKSLTANDTLTAGYNNLTVDNEALRARIRSLQAGISSRDRQIKAAEQEKTTLNNIMAGKDAKNDSLGRVIASLNSQIAGLNNAIAAGKAENKSLTDILTVKNNRIIADSLAEVKRLSAPREYGFVDIISAGGGPGLFSSDLDYENRLLSVDNLFGYQINRYFTTGIGIGAHFYDGGMLFPLYLDMRYKFGIGNLKPFISADGGFLLNFDDFGETTTFIQPTVGLSKKVGQKSYLNLGTGLSILSLTPVAHHRASFFIIKAGIQFPGKKGPEM